MTKGQRGRAFARIELLVAGLVILVVEPFLFVVSPGTTSSFVGSTGSWAPIASLMPIVGYVGQLVGLAWTTRLYRADPEPDQGAWRYRAR